MEYLAHHYDKHRFLIFLSFFLCVVPCKEKFQGASRSSHLSSAQLTREKSNQSHHTTSPTNQHTTRGLLLNHARTSTIFAHETSSLERKKKLKKFTETNPRARWLRSQRNNNNNSNARATPFQKRTAEEKLGGGLGLPDLAPVAWAEQRAAAAVVVVVVRKNLVRSGRNNAFASS